MLGSNVSKYVEKFTTGLYDVLLIAILVTLSPQLLISIAKYPTPGLTFVLVVSLYNHIARLPSLPAKPLVPAVPLPLEPLEPLVPSVPDVPLEPLVPLDPSVPEEPDVPLDALVPAVPEEPLVPEEPSPPAAPAKFIVHEEYVPDPVCELPSKFKLPVPASYDKTVAVI